MMMMRSLRVDGRSIRSALLCGIVLASAAAGALAQAAAPHRLLPLKVVGAHLLDSRDRQVTLRGVNTASLEWSGDGEGHILDTVRAAIQDWHVNIVRLPLAQDRWFGKAPGQTDDGTAYRALVKQVVEMCATQRCYILLDLHWSDTGEWGKQIGQHVMPDQNSIAFWKSLASIYKNDPAVLFDLYNEPHSVSWDIWHDGGMVTEKDNKTGETTYQAVGMQSMLDAVRSTGAQNVVVAGGLDWAYDLSGILAGKQLSDPKGHGVVYANHAYPFKGENVQAWTVRMEAATQKLPVIVSEFGSDAQGGAGETGVQWVQSVLQQLHDHDWSWIAWDLHPAASPCLISDWSYTPTPYFGAWVKQALSSTPDSH